MEVISYISNDKKKILNKKVVGGLLAFLISLSILGGVSRSLSNPVKDFELVKAKVIGNVKNEWLIDEKGNKTLNSSVEIDFNNDNVSDTKLHLIVDKKKISMDDMFPVLTIKNGDDLLLEAKVEKDMFGKVSDVSYPGNGVEEFDGNIIYDQTRGVGYLDASNLIMVNDYNIKEPRNKQNRSILNDMLNEKSR